MSYEWSQYQQAVFADVESGKGHTVVRARAGSGKTTVILESLARVPNAFTTLMVAFNKAIANELKQRVGSKVDAEISTLHSFGFRTCKKSLGSKLKLNNDRVWEFAKELAGADYESLTYRKALSKTVSLAKGALANTPEDITTIIDRFGIDVPIVDNDGEDRFVMDVLKVLDKCQNEVDQAIDFDDMIWLPHVLDLQPARYDRLFVDETQDLNPAQLSLAVKACKRGGRITAVGDDRQAIYGFRGADENAVRFIIDSLQAKVLSLSVTYRCARSIVQVANEIVPDLEAAPGAPEGLVAHTDVQAMMQGVQPGDFVLSRSNAPLVLACLQLLRKGVRASIQGRDIGAQLLGFVKRSKCGSVAELRIFIDQWEKDEVKRLQEKRRNTDVASDKAACLRVLSDGAQTVKDVEETIQRLFEDTDSRNRVVLSTTHKAKGLERDRVWVLADTYRRRPGTEEDNLWYVAVTRAKSELYLVNGEEQL